MATTRSFVTCTGSTCHAGNGGAASASSSDVMSASPFQDFQGTRLHELLHGFIIIVSFSPSSAFPFLCTSRQPHSVRWGELIWARLRCAELVWDITCVNWTCFDNNRWLRNLNPTQSIHLPRRSIKSRLWAEQPEWWGWPGMFWLGTCQTNCWRWGLAMDRVRKNWVIIPVVGWGQKTMDNYQHFQFLVIPHCS